jgi:hypothetical protein
MKERRTPGMAGGWLPINVETTSALYERQDRLGSIAQGSALRVAHPVGENQDRVDDAPDDRTDTAGDQPDDQLRYAQSGVAQIDAAYSDDPEKSEELQ